MHCCIPISYPTSDSNTSAECRGGVCREPSIREFHIVWRVVTLQNERVYANGDANRVDTWVGTVQMSLFALVQQQLSHHSDGVGSWCSAAAMTNFIHLNKRFALLSTTSCFTEVYLIIVTVLYTSYDLNVCVLIMVYVISFGPAAEKLLLPECLIMTKSLHRHCTFKTVTERKRRRSGFSAEMQRHAYCVFVLCKL